MPCLTFKYTIMKHQSFYEEYVKIAEKEIKELRRCLEAHGGSFSWDSDSDPDINKPCIAVGLDTGYAGDVRVNKIEINPSGAIRLEGTAVKDDFDVEFALDEIQYSHIEFIMDYLPEAPVSEVPTFTDREAENLVWLSADLMEWLSQDALTDRFGDSRERVSFLKQKAKQFEERLDHKDEDEGNYDYFEELAKFEKEIKDEVVDDIPLPF